MCATYWIRTRPKTCVDTARPYAEAGGLGGKGSGYWFLPRYEGSIGEGFPSFQRILNQEMDLQSNGVAIMV